MPELQQRETEEPWVGPWRAFLGMEIDDDWPDHIPPNVDCFAGGFAAGVAAERARIVTWLREQAAEMGDLDRHVDFHLLADELERSPVSDIEPWA